ncbi:hypothetical protein AA0242T_2218 [Acetobacter aceti NRIC 0242]|uniref:Fibronectin type-III domain-containing protein n=1 Tax=Acetobacter aceti NBRC 14818 TaxID=887700 RepID=A0AB33IKA1_ACEAC|nr:fibronectin type III domain-containing protein [Acetobacter aceti]TCS29684.1 fibronectin type III domain protein [Acetobacter aceti NBRC 14818]BCK77184.1 hypothetical protein EMQ_2790 [Acetobacter aceti NBRC 14818]GAN58603.1 peptidase S53 propeptide [Acetobacter aceti NBRC 14818]GBO81516.1 hypothetical protein AA0242T_2218 [Acetobacter aceti NRIC 0242]
MASWTQTSDTSITAAIAAVGAGGTLVNGWIDLAGSVWSAANIASDSNAADFYLTSTKQSTPWTAGQLFRPASEDSINQRVTMQVCLNSGQTYYAMLRSNRSSSSANGYLVSVDYMSDKKYAIHGFAIASGKLTQFVGQDLATQPAQGDVVTLDIQLTQVTTTTSEIVVTVSNASGTVLGTYDSGAANATVNTAALQNVAGSAGVCAYSGSGGALAGLKEITVYSGDAAPSTATKYTVAPASSTVQTGSSTEVTFALDAAAAQDVTITPGDGGAGGSWSSATLKIAAGSLSGTLEYTAGSKAGAVTLTGTNDSSLTNGTASLTVQASATAPGAPGVTLTAGSGQITVKVVAPSSDGGSAITGYPIYVGTTSGGESSTPVTTLTAAGSYTITGLTNGTPVYVKVGATNGVGTTVAAEQTATPVSSATAPGAPGVTLTAGNGQIVVQVVAPSSDGGSPITGYPIVVNDATSPVTTLTVAGSYTITGLTNGTAYKVKVGAANSVGATYSADQTATPLAPGSAVPVDNPAFLFSPGNWYGDSGRGGSLWRRTWNVGAYFVFTWNASANPTAVIDFGLAGTSGNVNVSVNGSVKEFSAASSVTLWNIIPSAENTVFVVFRDTPQSGRWNEGANNIVVSGVTLDAASTAGVSVAGEKGWVKIIGDSITEGINSGGANKPDFTQSYTYFLLQTLRAQGYEVCVSVCGYSGYLDTGDSTADVPAYYYVSGSSNGSGGTYDDTKSRWNKIDENVSALDSNGHLTAYGDTGSEPVATLVNYLTNEALGKLSTSDCQAAMMQCMKAHRTAAPNAWLFLMIPVGFHYAPKYPAAYLTAFNAAISAYQAAYPLDKRVAVVDIGDALSTTIEVNTGSLINTDQVHPLSAGHALIAPAVSGQMLLSMEGSTAVARSPNYGPASSG